MFIIANFAGKELATVEHFEIALEKMRSLPTASHVLRASDGELLARLDNQKKKRGDT